MANIGHMAAMDAEYIRSGRWICKPSPTGAHHWIEIEMGTMIFRCKYCDEERKYPVGDGQYKMPNRKTIRRKQK